MQKPQAFLIDIDRTLVNNSMEITDRTAQALKKVSQAGIEISLCSGRGFASVKPYVMTKVPVNHNLHILDGGGKLISSTGEVKWQKQIDSELVNAIIQNVLEAGGEIGLYEDDCLYLSPGKIEKFKNHPWKIPFKEISAKTNYQTCLLSINHLNQQIRDYIQSISEQVTIKEMNNYEGKRYFDITATGVNKATAAKIWAELQGLDLNQITAIGDSENDLEVIEVAGFGIAMGNAVESLKQKADLVIGDVEQDGLAEYLEKLLAN